MKLYCGDGSPPVRAVYLCLEALGLKPERKYVNMGQKEHLSPEYLKMNPQHSIPTLDDDGFYIWDSHAINAYLVAKYAKNDSLYPKDVKVRAIVDQRLHFDSGSLYPVIRDIVFPLLFLKCKSIPDEKKKRATDAFELMEKFLEGRDYLAADHYTIADFCCVASVSTLVEAMRISVDKFPKTRAWLERCKENLPGYQEAQKGLGNLKMAVASEMGWN